MKILYNKHILWEENCTCGNTSYTYCSEQLFSWRQFERWIRSIAVWWGLCQGPLYCQSTLDCQETVHCHSNVELSCIWTIAYVHQKRPSQLLASAAQIRQISITQPTYAKPYSKWH